MEAGRPSIKHGAWGATRPVRRVDIQSIYQWMKMDVSCWVKKTRTVFGAAQPGDHLFCPFQCELCLFRNIQGRSPLFGEGNLNGVVLLRSLLSANINAFWSREPKTVAHSLSKVNHILQLGFELGMDNTPLPVAKPWPVNDNINATGGGCDPLLLFGPW
jgi:hypothetical protein